MSRRIGPRAGTADYMPMKRTEESWKLVRKYITLQRRSIDSEMFQVTQEQSERFQKRKASSRRRPSELVRELTEFELRCTQEYAQKYHRAFRDAVDVGKIELTGALYRKFWRDELLHFFTQRISSSERRLRRSGRRMVVSARATGALSRFATDLRIQRNDWEHKFATLANEQDLLTRAKLESEEDGHLGVPGRPPLRSPEFIDSAGELWESAPRIGGEVTRGTLEQIAAKFDEKGYSPKEAQTGLRSTARSAISVFNTDLGNSSAPRIHTYVEVVKKGVIMVDREHLRAKTGSDVRHDGESPRARVDLLRDLRRILIECARLRERLRTTE
jgi:hypothetical protein